MSTCLYCGKETKNPKYCTRSCSASHTNTLYPRRKTKKLCTICNAPVVSYKYSHCLTHHNEYKAGKYQSKTIGEYRQKLSVKGKHPSWLHSHIRSFARSWLKDMTVLPCTHCGYDKHVELAHIKDVASFSDDILLSIVNSKDNVIPLCPNCHWEFDNLPRMKPLTLSS